MENKLVLKDGTEIEGGFASRSSQNQLMVRIPGNDIVNATLTFSNPEKTAEITCYYGIHKTVYTGYTNVYSIQYFAGENRIELWLNGEQTSMKDELTVPSIYVPEEKPLTPEGVTEDE